MGENEGTERPKAYSEVLWNNNDCPYYYLWEAAALWAGKNVGDEVEFDNEDRPIDTEVVARWLWILKALLNRDLRGGRDGFDSDWFNIHPESVPYRSLTIRKKYLNAWFKDNCPDVPNPFEKAEKSTIAGQPYLDRKHPNYASELALAIKVWLALYAQGGARKGRAHGTAVKEWLREQVNIKNESFEKRIATLTNPDVNKKGGAPRT